MGVLIILHLFREIAQISENDSETCGLFLLRRIALLSEKNWSKTAHGKYT